MATAQDWLLHGTHLAEVAGQLAIVAIHDVLQTCVLYITLGLLDQKLGNPIPVDTGPSRSHA